MMGNGKGDDAGDGGDGDDDDDGDKDVVIMVVMVVVMKALAMMRQSWVVAVLKTGWWLIPAAMAVMTGSWEGVSSQFTERSWGHSVLSTFYVFVHWLLHRSRVAWRSYTTHQGPCEPEVSSGGLLDHLPLQHMAVSSVSSGLALVFWDQHRGERA